MSQSYETMKFRHLRSLIFARSIGTPGWRVTATKAKIIAALHAADGNGQATVTAVLDPTDPVDEPTASEPTRRRRAATVEPVGGDSSGLAAVLAEHLGPYMKSAVNREQVEAIIDEKFDDIKAQVSSMSRHVVIDNILTGEMNKPIGVQHKRFDALLRIAQLRLHSYLVGPMGSGKTSACKFIAESLGLPHAQKSVGLQTTEMDLLGYRDSGGTYQTTDLRRCYENGGVFLLDEVDAGNPQVLVVLNSLLANGECSFPDGMVKKHPDFVLLAGANTYGLGGDRQYVGRCQLDASTLDRFVYLSWDYDTNIESSMCGVDTKFLWNAPTPEIVLDAIAADERQAACERYVGQCCRVRQRLHELGGAVRMGMSPRTLAHGCMLIRSGFSIDDAMEMCLWRGTDTMVRSKLS